MANGSKMMPTWKYRKLPKMLDSRFRARMTLSFLDAALTEWESVTNDCAEGFFRDDVENMLVLL
jgi:hypothetical protein